MHHWHKQKICKDKVYHVIKLKLMLGVLKYDYVVLVQMSPLQILRLSTNTISTMPPRGIKALPDK